MNNPKNLMGFLLLVLMLAVSACSELTKSDKPATVNWWLKPYTGVSHTTSVDSPVPVALSVEAIPGLDTDRILALSENAELTPFLAANWVDYLPELVNSLVGRSLEASGRFEIATSATLTGVGSCQLQLELREFFAKLDASGEVSGVRVAMTGRYHCGSDEPSFMQLSAIETVNDQRMNVIVAAFQSALDSVTRDMLGQIP